MYKFLFVILTMAFTANVALAADTDCLAKATEIKLAGAAKASFIKKCEKDTPTPGICAIRAADKRLAGAAKASFMKKCEKDAMVMTAPGNCLNQADGKKLAGAAKASFIKKCEKDAKGAK